MCEDTWLILNIFPEKANRNLEAVSKFLSNNKKKNPIDFGYGT